MIPSDEEILRAIVALGDDGFVPRHRLVAHFRGQGEREMRRAIGRSARRGGSKPAGCDNGAYAGDRHDAKAR